MGVVIEIEGFKSRRLQRLEAERRELLRRHETLHAEGKLVAAEAVLARAKEIRKALSRLRGADVTSTITMDQSMVNYTGISFPIRYASDVILEIDGYRY